MCLDVNDAAPPWGAEPESGGRNRSSRVQEGSEAQSRSIRFPLTLRK